MSKPRILSLVRPRDYELLFLPETDQALRDLGETVFEGHKGTLNSQELAQRIAGFDAVLTGWGSPRFTDEVLDAADCLRVIAHSAGSIKNMLPRPVFERGITVTHAASAIAPAVAELSLAMTLILLRNVVQLDRCLKSGDWQGAKTLPMGRELVGLRVGVVGAGYTGRCFIDLLRALKAEVWVYDPYLSAGQAAEMGVRTVALDDLFAECPVVSVQAPATEETYHMISSRQFGLLQDGACFVNTARSWVVDYDALLAELQTGRIVAALDVFDREPLPEDNPFRELDNVVMTPHVAGASLEARSRQGQYMVGELSRFFSGEPLLYQVTADMLDTMA
jgi:phosphoglycerate dehydrogenase-like enzyme